MFENASAVYSEFASAIFEHVFDSVQLGCKLILLFSISTACDDVIVVAPSRVGCV